MTAGWVEWIMGIDAVSRPGCRVTTFCLPCTEIPPQTIDPPDTAKAAAELAKQALKTGRPVADLVVEAGLMTKEDVMRELSPAKISGMEA